MDLGTAGTTSRYDGRPTDSDDRITEQRLAELLRLNAAIALENQSYRSERERLDASLMTRPVTSAKAFSYFGLMIGSLPPLALAFKIIGETASVENSPALFIVLLMAAGIATGAAGYASGRFVPSIVNRLSDFRLPNRIALISLVGLTWGAVSGAVGGLFLFLIGAVFAAIAGGIIGAVAVPPMVFLHSTLRRGDLIERKHFLPIAFGITLVLSAIIVGW